MKDRIDCAIRNMFLRRKLHSIEEAKKKYPATPEGRKAFIKDSLKEDHTRSGCLEGVLCVILSPVIVPICIYAGGVWLYRKVRGEL